MTRDEFQTQLNRLMSVYGEKAYPPERFVLLWKSVSNLSQEWLERTVNDLISTSRQAPLLTEFGPFIGIERERVHKLAKEKQAVHGSVAYSCDFCRDNGVYLCTLNGDRAAPYAFRCHCSRGHGDPRKFIPQYRQDHKAQGFTYYELGWSKEMSA